MQGFYDDNSRRSYPFPDDAAMTMFRASDSATVLLPLPTIVDFGCVIGPGAGWLPTHRIYLREIERHNQTLVFLFASTNPSLMNKRLSFSRNIADQEYAVERSSAVNWPGATPAYGRCGDPAVWSGFLATGSMAPLAALLVNGDALVANAADTPMRQASVQDLGGSYVRSINLANQGRVVYTPPPGCPGYNPGTDGLDDVHVAAICIQGDVQLQSGMNCEARQSDRGGSITLTGRAGAGDLPCYDPPRYPDEVIVPGPSCSDLIGRVNGASGASIILTPIGGVSISLGDDPHTVIIDFDLADLAGCAQRGSSINPSTSIPTSSYPG